MSRKVLVSLPSRKATSGLISSPTSRTEAFLAIRCVSITNWLAASNFAHAGPGLQLERGDLLGQLQHHAVFVVDGGNASCRVQPGFSPDRSRSLHPCRSQPKAGSRHPVCGRTSSGEAGTLIPPTSPPFAPGAPAAARRYRVTPSTGQKPPGYPAAPAKRPWPDAATSMRISPAAAM
jgi:hypothetical protein